MSFARIDLLFAKTAVSDSFARIDLLFAKTAVSDSVARIDLLFTKTTVSDSFAWIAGFQVVLGWAYRGLTGGCLVPEFQCCNFCESSCLLYLSFNFDFCVSKIMHL